MQCVVGFVEWRRVSNICRPLSKAYQWTVAIAKTSVRLSVTRVIYGESREQIEFMFASNLFLENSSAASPKVSPPHEGELWKPI